MSVRQSWGATFPKEELRFSWIMSSGFGGPSDSILLRMRFLALSVMRHWCCAWVLQPEAWWKILTLPLLVNSHTILSTLPSWALGFLSGRWEQEENLLSKPAAGDTCHNKSMVSVHGTRKVTRQSDKTVHFTELGTVLSYLYSSQNLLNLCLNSKTDLFCLTPYWPWDQEVYISGLSVSH